MRLDMSGSPLQMPASGGMDFLSSPPSHASCGPYQHKTPEGLKEVAQMAQASRESLQFSPSNGHGGPTAQTTLEGLAKRKAVSEWIQQICGIYLPYETDQSFRASLRDGVVLCSLIETLFPGSAPQVVRLDPNCSMAEVLQQRSDNVSTFLRAAQLVVPAQSLLTLDDLESESPEDRGRVVDTLLCLHQAQQSASPYRAAAQLPSAMGSPSQHLNSSPMAAPHHPDHHRHLSPPAYNLSSSSSPLTDAFAANSAARASHALVLPHQNGLVAMQRSSGNFYGAGSTSQSIQSAHFKGVQAAAGVTRLMQQCTAMLKERMFVDAAPRHSPTRFQPAAPAAPEMALEGIGPVLEGVLGSLTQEYEKRLLAKDHELNDARDHAAALAKQLEAMQAGMQQLHAEVEVKTAAAAAAAASSTASDTVALQQELMAARAVLEAQAGELEQLREAAQDSGQLLLQREGLLRSELAVLQAQLEALQGVDAKYRRVVEENRKLYNQVQDLRGNIRVFCRLRPAGATGDPTPSCIDVGLEGDLAVYDSSKGERRLFRVDRVFDEGVNQLLVYEDTQPLIRSVLDGYNVCIFAYGQTGSGKTHTMSGTDVQHLEGRGINYRALDDLFSIRDARVGEVDYQITVQMLEIYNETLRDLLADNGSVNNRLEILNTQASGCNVPGATKFEVHSSGDVEKIMAYGSANRHTSETRMNDRSSRSHQILTVLVEGHHLVTGARSHGCLHLIDLAGSERVSKSEASGDRLVEAQHINRSLSALGDVMAALASKSQHIPFRNSKLTQLLADSLCGQAKVMMFMHISPEANMYHETVSTLKFASRVSEITLGQARRNVESGKVFEAHEQVSQLREVAASRESQVQELCRALEAERSAARAATMERDGLALEARELRGQLEAARTALALTQRQQPQLPGGPTGSPARAPPLAAVAAAAASPSRVPQLALGAAVRSAAAPPAAAAAAEDGEGEDAAGSSSSGGGGSRLDAARLAMLQEQHRQQEAGMSTPHGPSSSKGAPSDVPGMGRLDGTPVRDQNMGVPTPVFTPRTERSDLSMSTPRTGRSTGKLSASKHIDRLQSARLRQSGVFSSSNNAGFLTHRPSTAAGGGAGAAAAAPPSGSMTARGPPRPSAAPAAAIGRPPLTARGSRPTSSMPPMTSRVASMAKAALASSINSAASASTAAPAAPSGTSTSRATSRSGSRWK